MNNIVSLNYVEDYSYEEVDNAFSKAFGQIGGLANYIKPKEKVMLKCSLGGKYEPDDAMSTHPTIVKIIADKIIKLGASCIIVDNSENLNTNISKIYETTQMLDASNEGDAELNSNENVFKVDYEGKLTKKLTLIDAVNDVDVIINVPKLVVDSKYGLKGCFANLFGLIPTEEQIILKSRLFTPNEYNNYLLDLYNYFKDKIVLNVVDGIVAHESNGCQRIMNALIVGENPFAVENVILKILNKDTKENLLLNAAINRNIINSNIPFSIVGDNWENFVKPDFSYPIVSIESSYEKMSRAKSNYKTYQARPNILTSKCKGCGVCIQACPNKAISEKYDKNNEMYACLDYSKCISCFRCVRACPYQVIDTITPSKNKKLSSRLDKRIVKATPKAND